MTYLKATFRLAAIALITVVAWAGLGPPSVAATTLRIALDSDLNTLDPAKMKTGVEYNYAYSVFSGLTEFDRDLNVKPDLAESWESSKDLKVWTFHLRKGVKFHNGREVDAEDVLTTIKRILNPEIGSVLRVNFEIVDSMEAVDPHTVRFKLKIPYAVFPSLFAAYQARIVPRDALDTLTTKPIGTGPFKFVEYMPGDRLTVEKNPDYFIPGEPKVDKVIFRIIPEHASSLVALEAGDVDIYWSLPPEQIDALAKSTTARADEVATGQWWAFVFNNTLEPFTNLKIRQAFAKLVDKEAFAEIAALGHGTPTHTPIPPSHPFYAKDIPLAKPDYEGAKKLIAESGVDRSKLNIPLWTPAGIPELERMAVAFRDSAKKIGIDIDVRVVPQDKFFGEIEGKRPFHTTIFYDRIVLDVKLYAWFHSNGSWNDSEWHFKDARMDQVLDQARQTADEAVQKKLYTEFQKIMLDKVPGVVVYVSNHANGVRNVVKGFHSMPTLLMDLRNVTVGS